jgi:hypothetical protein
MSEATKCPCGRKLKENDKELCRFCVSLPKDANGKPAWRYCLNCGGIINGGGNRHYAPPGGGIGGFFVCSSFPSLSQKPMAEWMYQPGEDRDDEEYLDEHPWYRDEDEHQGY